MENGFTMLNRLTKHTSNKVGRSTLVSSELTIKLSGLILNGKFFFQVESLFTDILLDSIDHERSSIVFPRFSQLFLC
jgi:hypothetical protein